MSEHITDEMVEAAAKAFANHEYRINGPEMMPYCTCGQAATFRYDVDWYDQHVARLTLEAAAPAIAAKALRDFADWMTSGLNKETLNAERRAIKREARALADSIEANPSALPGPEKRTTPCSAVKSGHHCKRFDPHGDSHVWVVTATATEEEDEYDPEIMRAFNEHRQR